MPITMVENAGVLYLGCTRPNAAEQRLVGGHRERAAGGRKDRGLGRRHGRDHHRDHQEDADRAEQHILQCEEHVVGVRLVAEAQPGIAQARVRHRRDGHADVGDQQDERRQDRGTARRALGVFGLLVECEAGVPAPVDEQGEQDGLHEAREVAERERVEPAEVGRRRCQQAPGRSRSATMTATTKTTSARYWMPSRTFWIFSPISVPR